MHKRIALLATLVAAAAAGTACQKDFLTEVPSSFVAPENFYKTQADALAALSGAYATFINLPSPLSNSDYLGRNLEMLVEYPTEVVTSRLSATNERSLIGDFHTQFNSTHSYLQSVWEAAYFGINRANVVIDRVPSIQMDTVRRNQIVAEAKFLRAVHYYWLAGLFGGVPLKLSATTADVVTTGANIPRATATETWKQIEKDLTEAAAVLPVSWPTSDWGRATRGAALALLGKAYLQAASTGAGSPTDYASAATALRTVTTLGYTLDPNYLSLFNGTNERSPEIIWSIQNIRAAGAGGYYSQWFTPVTSPAIYGPGAQNQFQAERPFYDTYASTDIRKHGTWFDTLTYAGKVVPWTWTSGIQNATAYGSTGPVPRKYVDLSPPANGAEEPDVIILRYGESLLSLAEAINESSGPTGEAYGFVNQVRSRAKIANFPAGLSQSAFRDSLYVERRRELALEMNGVFDMRRDWKFAKSRVEANMAQISTLNKSPFTSSVEKFNAAPIPDKWQLYPIPAHACELNSALTQNPGWEDGICK